MHVDRLTLGPLETNCWIVRDGRGGPLVVIDPADEPARILEAIAGRPVVAVVLTHKHFDHIGAVREVLAETGAPLLVHAADAADLATAAGTGGEQFGIVRTAPAPDRLLAAGDIVEAGDLTLAVLHTPGHTRGGICLLAHDAGAEGPDHLFSGDTLFAGSVGRTDFEGGDGRELARSLAREIAPLAGDTVVHPGHGPDSTIGRERRVNPFLPRA